MHVLPKSNLEPIPTAPKMPAPTSFGAEPLDLLQALVSSLHRANVSYCYWKSSRRLQAVLAGEADLDLLVARDDQHRAGRTLLECGFKLFPSVAHRDHPAILSFLGHDEPSGRIVHVHLHARLVAGERLLRNHRLPWEAAILANAVLDPASRLRMLDPASEAVLLAVRSCLELRAQDPVTLLHWRAAKRKATLDREASQAGVDWATVRGRAAEFLSDGTAGLLADAACGDGPWRSQSRLRRAIERDLAGRRMYGAGEARLRAASRAAHWLAGGLNQRYLHLPRPWSRRAPGGGSVIALLGVDGSGKSTVAAAVRAWLGAEIDVLPMYFGTGDGRSSLLLLPLKLAAPLLTRLLGKKPNGSSHGALSGQAPGTLYSALLMAWSTVLAVEKRRKLLAAHRGAARGLVVVTDRYPHDGAIDYNDGPLLPRVASAPPWLRRFEARAYALAGALPPDLVLKLVATPEVLAAREPDMDLGVIRQRAGALRELAFPGARVVCVDATQPLADVIRAVKREIWSVL